MISVSKNSPRVLVVGWGFLGQAIGSRLSDGGASVIALTQSATIRTAAAEREGIEVVLGPAEDPATLLPLLKRVDHVVYAAGGMMPGAAAADAVGDALKTITPIVGVLEGLRNTPAVGITIISSGGTVYGNPEQLPVRENAPLAPISPYGVSRAATEMYARSYAQMHGLPIQIVRCANVYGPGQPHDKGQGVVGVFLHHMANGLPITVIGDGSAVRDYLFIDDAAAAIASLVSSRIPIDTVNVGSGRGHTTMEVLAFLEGVTGIQADIRYVPARSIDVAAIVLDISRLCSVIDYTPTKLNDGIAATWSQHEANRASHAADA